MSQGIPGSLSPVVMQDVGVCQVPHKFALNLVVCPMSALKDEERSLRLVAAPQVAESDRCRLISARVVAAGSTLFLSDRQWVF